MSDAMEVSFWEQQTFFNDIDVAIIGSGIVGLSTALNLNLLDPKLKIVIIERGIYPYGASTRNAGFACFGSASELMDDMSHISTSEVFSLVEERFLGLKRLREMLSDVAIDYEHFNGYEIFTDADEKLYEQCMARLSDFNLELEKITGEKNIYSNADEKIKEFGFANVRHLICNKGEGQIDTGKMMHALLRSVQSKGIAIYNNIQIDALEEKNGKVNLKNGKGLNISAKNVIVCTNGFAKKLLPHTEVKPARSQVLITEPLPHLKIKGCFHYDKGFYYFRNVKDRILFGGGRNLDFETEETDDFGLTKIVQEKLESLLHEMILPNVQFKIEQRWSGIMGIGPTKNPIIEKISDGVYCAVRMGGMGVAIGSRVGMRAAEMLMRNQ